MLAGLLVALGVVAGVFAGPDPASAAAAPVACGARAGEPRAETLAVVVTFGNGVTRTRCTTSGGSGIEVLRRAGFAPTTQSYGTVGGGDTAVCSLTDPYNGTVEGCDSGPRCLTCLQPDAWGYFPGYRYSQIGAGDTRPGAGTVEAWRWGRSSSWPGAKPRVADICVPEQPPTTPSTPEPTTPPGGGGGGTANPRPPGGSANPVTPQTPDGSGSNGQTPSGQSGGSGADPAQGSGDPAGSTSPSADPTASTTTAPGSPSTTAPAAVTTEAADETGAAADAATTGDEPSTAAEAATADERAIDVKPVGAAGVAGSDSGSPWKPMIVTALVVGALAALAVRARRGRAPANAD